MKTLGIVVGVIVLLIILFQAYISMATNKTETQDYKVLFKESNFEIRYYPTSTMAVISSSIKSYRELGSSGFRKLAAYIFGGNSENTQIAMTSPVHMEIGDSISSMAFVMPSMYKLEDLPNPNDPSVTLKEVDEEYVAVIQFDGFGSEKRIETYTNQLKEMLTQKGIPFIGHFRYLGYNPPYQLVGRRNEVIVKIPADAIPRIGTDK